VLNGSALVVKDADGALRFLNSTNGAEAKALPGFAKVHSLQFNVTGEWFLFVDQDKVHVHRAQDGSRGNTVRAANTVSAVAWHPNGRSLAIPRQRESAADLHVGQFVQIHLRVVPRLDRDLASIAAHAQAIPRAVEREFFSAFVSGAAFSRGGYCSLNVAQPEGVIEGEASISLGHLTHVNHDGSLAASWSEQASHRLQIWNPQSGQLLTNLIESSSLREAIFSPDNRSIAVSTADATTLRSIPDWQIQHRISQPVEGRHRLAFNPSGRILASAV